MTLFVDTNVLLDVLMEREPFFEDSAKLWLLVERKMIRGLVSVISFTNGRYIIRKAHGKQVADESLQLVRDIFEPVPFDTEMLDKSIASGWDDFEDDGQYFSAMQGEASHLVTQNVRDFPTDQIKVITPTQFLSMYAPA